MATMRELGKRSRRMGEVEGRSSRERDSSATAGSLVGPRPGNGKGTLSRGEVCR